MAVPAGRTTVEPWPARDSPSDRLGAAIPAPVFHPTFPPCFFDILPRLSDVRRLGARDTAWAVRVGSGRRFKQTGDVDATVVAVAGPAVRTGEAQAGKRGKRAGWS